MTFSQNAQFSARREHWARLIIEKMRDGMATDARLVARALPRAEFFEDAVRR